MADYYTQFSSIIPCPSRTVRDQLQYRLNNCMDEFGEETPVITHLGPTLPGEERYPPCGVEIDGDNIWVYSEDYGNLEAVANIVAAIQKEFEIDEAWAAEYSFSCSKPRLDGFGGGCVVVCKGVQYWLSTSDWMLAKIKEVTA